MQALPKGMSFDDILASYFKKHLTEWIQPQMLRAPEVILGASWDFRADIWNVGVLVSAHIHRVKNFVLIR